MASIGHVVDLPPRALGVDVEAGFKPHYEVIKGKKGIIENLKRAARKAPRVYLAPDPDREGEAIAYHIAQVIDNGATEIHRAVFHEVTPTAIREAIENPTDINLNLFNAQQARRILDRLVGYKISPILWTKIKRGLSAGRVQSVAMRLICEREAEIRAFQSKEYWSVEAQAEADQPPPFVLKLQKIDGKPAEIPDQAAADAIVEATRDRPFVVGEVARREESRRPFAPFITSTLQQEASRKLRFTARQTMRLAQRLYEGVDLGEEGPVGLITYMRTDSTRLSETALSMIRAFIGSRFDAAYLPDQPRVFSRGKSAQDAHEAIRPTDVRRTPEAVRPYLDKEAQALYTLIWNRAVASQMADARVERTRVEIPVDRYIFVATGSVLQFPGFLAIYEETKDEGGKTEAELEGAEPVLKEGEGRLPPLETGQRVRVTKIEGKQHFTQPPPRFTEAGLIKELERRGIGRPSTYAQIISTIQDRGYAVKEAGTFRPTELGDVTTQLLIESFPQVMDVKFTAMMEGQLDDVEEGKVDWVELLRKFYLPFQKRVQSASERMRNLKAEVTPTEYTCDRCGSPMVVRWGRNGRFLACSAYPECRNTKPVVMTEDGKIEILKDEVTDQTCERCGRPMVIKSGRRGRFLACSGYPECKTSRPLPIGVPCPRPGCAGELVERQSARGRPFYSCSAYPDCRFLVGTRPRLITCDVCGQSRHIVGPPTRLKVFGCDRADCPYTPVYRPGEDAEAVEGPRRRGRRRRDDPASGG